MPKDDAFWLNVCYVVFGILVAFVCKLAIETVGIQTGWLERYDAWFPLAMYGGGMAVGVVSTLAIRANAERRDYFLASIAEIKKVTWPSLDDTKRMTIIVSVVVAVFAGILAVFDTVWSFLMKQLLQLV